MRSIIILISGLVMIHNGNCSGNEPAIAIEEILELKGVASASGIEVLQDGIYVIGDNTPYIFKLNKDLLVTQKHLLFSGFNTADSIYEKAVKPDLEAVCKPEKAGNTLWLFGSGSGYEERDVLIVFDAEGQTTTTQYSLFDFYKNLRTTAHISESDFNIEGAVVAGENLYLFNRGNNMVFRIKFTDFRKFLTDPEFIPQAEIFEFELPEIDGIKAGFSGVTFIAEEEIFLITASVEDTDNWIDDGEVLGSYVGLLKLNDIEKNVQPRWIKLSHNGLALQKKVESITTLPQTTKGGLNLLMVTDSDGGISEIIKANLSGL